MTRKSKTSFNLGQLNLFGEIAPAMPTAASQGERQTIPEGTPRVRKTTDYQKNRHTQVTTTPATNLFAGDTMSAEDFIKVLEFDNWRRNEALLSRGETR